MEEGKKLGWLGSFLDAKDFESLKESAQKPKEIMANSAKSGHEQRIRSLDQEKDQNNQEKQNRGNPTPSVIFSRVKEMEFNLVLVIVSFIGEFIFARWCIEPFGLGSWETVFMAMTTVIIFMKGVDFLLSALETKWPQHISILNLVCGGIGSILVFLLIFTASDIRGLMFHTTATLRNATSAEETVHLSEMFFGNASRPFVLLMMILTAAITVIGGITYHRTMGQLFPLLQIRRLDKRLKQIDREISKNRQAIAVEDSNIAQFAADIQLGFCEEMVRQKQRNASPQPTSMIQMKSLRGKIIAILLLGGLICFFLLKGIARGEVLTLFDLSGSMEVQGYSGNETEFQKNNKGLEKMLEIMPPGEFFKVFGITEKTFSSPYTMLDGKIGSNKGAFGEVLARDRLKAVNQWKKLNPKPTAIATDIFGGIHLASILFSDVKSKRKNLVLFSDMRQSSDGIDFERPSELQVEPLLGQVKRKGMIPSLQGVKVWCLGVHASGKTPAYWQSLKRFWEQYFKLANVAKLCAFTMERELNLEEF